MGNLSQGCVGIVSVFLCNRHADCYCYFSTDWRAILNVNIYVASSRSQAHEGKQKSLSAMTVHLHNPRVAAGLVFHVWDSSRCLEREEIANTHRCIWCSPTAGALSSLPVVSDTAGIPADVHEPASTSGHACAGRPAVHHPPDFHHIPYPQPNLTQRPQTHLNTIHVSVWEKTSRFMSLGCGTKNK